jgi:phenylacetate-CoA ligase
MSFLRQQLWRFGNTLAGSRAWQCYQEFLRLGSGSPETLSELSKRRLERLVAHAVREVPYYREHSRSANRLEDFPILTKRAIREHFFELMTPALAAAYPRRGGGYGWVAVQTGGTSGVPTTVVHGPTFRDYGRAARAYSQTLCGFPPGTPYLRLWGSMKDIQQMGESLVQRAQRWVAGETLLNAFRMDRDRMRGYLDRLSQSRARHLMAYVDCAAELARFARSAGIRVRPLASIMACAGTVTEDVRRLLEDTFGGRVHNNYGSRDCSAMACECSEGGLHIYTNHAVLEVVDDSGAPLPAGASGRILVTLLHNYEFPLIRYEIGDVGALEAKPCRCGLAFPRLARVEGRVQERIRTPAGTYLSPVYVRHLVGVVHNPGLVRRFQLVQETPVEFLLRLELEPGTDDEAYRRVAARLVEGLQSVLGQECRIRLRRESRIEEEASGKFLYVVSRQERVCG